MAGEASGQSAGVPQDPRGPGDVQTLAARAQVDLTGTVDPADQRVRTLVYLAQWTQTRSVELIAGDVEA